MIRYDSTFEATVAQIKFDKKLYSQVIQLEPEFIQEINLDVAEYIASMVSYRWTSKIWGIDKTAIAGKYPSTTWQHFKHDYGFKWFVNRFPVKYTKVTLKLTEVLNKKLKVTTQIPSIFMVNEVE